MIISSETAKMLVGAKCVIYCRVSTKDQIKGTSLDEQEAICLDFARRFKMNVVKIYKEDASAMKAMQREKFNSMVKDMQNGEAEVIVCAMSDRLSRNGGDAYVIQELIEDDNVIVAVAMDNVILQNPLNPNDMLLFGVKNLISNYEVQLLKQRCKAGILAKHLLGFRPTRVPYGYFNDKSNNTAIVMKSRSEFILKAFELYATGDFTIPEISSELYSQGYLYELTPDKQIPKQSLYTMLRNIFYTGEYVVKRTGQIQKGNHEAIVPKELFDKVQKMLDVSPKSPCKNHLLYQQFLTCEACGRNMTGDVKTKGDKQYVYYVCKNENCPRKYRTTELKIDSEVAEYLKEIRLGLIPDDMVVEVLKDELYAKNQKLSIMKRQRSHKYSAEQKIYARITENDIVDEKYIRGEYAKIQEKYGNLESKIYLEETQIETIKSKVNEILKKRLYDVFIDFDTKTKRKTLELISNSFKFTNKGLKMTYKPAFRKIRKR